MKYQDRGGSRQSQEDGIRDIRTKSNKDRKGWMTHRLVRRGDRLLQNQQRSPWQQNQPGQRLRSSHKINLNKPYPSTHETSEQKGSSILKRKFTTRGTVKPTFQISEGDSNEAQDDVITKKRRQQPDERTTLTHSQDKELDNEDNAGENHTNDPGSKPDREKERQKRKKKRQQIERQARDEEHCRRMENKARQAEAESPGPRRFLVAVPLASLRNLSGGSVSGHFRKRDLSLNDMLPVTLEALLESSTARTLYKALKGPIYFPGSCAQMIDRLKKRLKCANVCSKLIVISISHFNKVTAPNLLLSGQNPRLLGKQTLDAIEQVLEDSQPPHELESSQNAEEKIKCLFRPILRSLNLEDTIITTGFCWREQIGLRSSVDLGIHDYKPKSDAAIIKITSETEAQILVLFEAYSRLGQSLKTPDENRADRVRLLIQGSYISIRDEKPSVVFYLTRDKHMETILIFSENQEYTKFGYYAEKQPFYNEVTWVDLICQIINIVGRN